MKRESALALTALLAFAPVACSDDATGNEGAAGPSADADQTDAAADVADAGQSHVDPEAGPDVEPGSTDAGADTGTDAATAEACLMDHCMPELTACMGDAVCSGWMDCIQQCGDDMMKCPTFCGLYYPSPLANDFIGCALDEACMSIDFSAYPPCEVPTADLEDLGGMGGTWWFAMHHGEDYLFDYDCQKLMFEEVSPTYLNVDYSVPLTHQGESRIAETHGSFQQRDDGSVLVEYGTFLGYHEDWYVVHKSDHAIVAHVCFASDADAKEYGTLVVTREPLEELDASEREAIDQAIEEKLGLDPEGFQHASMEGCENAG